MEHSSLIQFKVQYMIDDMPAGNWFCMDSIENSGNKGSPSSQQT